MSAEQARPEIYVSRPTCGDGYPAALVNFRFLAQLWTTQEAIALVHEASGMASHAKESLTAD